MLRRIHVSQPLRGDQRLSLDPDQAHHVRDVLRLKTNDPLELFDDAGTVALVRIIECDPSHVAVAVEQVQEKTATGEIVIASAVPKGDRADWMVEKLSELGVTRFVPLATARGVVLPTGQNKRDRWTRIATESAKQSRRAGVMQIDALTPLKAFLDALTAAGRMQNDVQSNPCIFYLSTKENAVPILSSSILHPSSLTFLIGPEGGWTGQEIDLFKSSHLTGVKLTGTILRVETAAIAAAALVACRLENPPGK